MHASKLTVLLVLSTFAAPGAMSIADEPTRITPAEPLPTFEDADGFAPLATPATPADTASEFSVEDLLNTIPAEPDNNGGTPRNLAYPARPIILPQAEDLNPATGIPAPLNLEGTFHEAGTESPPAPARTSAASPVVMQAVPTVSITTTGPQQINVGKAATYTITVRNAGQTTVEALQIHIDVPASAEMMLTTPQPIDADGDSLRFNVGDLSPAAERHVQLVLKPLRRAEINLSARATFSASAATAVHVTQPQLEIVCEAPEQADFGAPVEFVLTVSNIGDGTAEGVFLAAEAISSRTEDESTFEVGSLKPGESKVLRLGAEAAAAGSMESVFRVWDDSGLQATTQSLVRVRQVILELAVNGPRASYLHRDSVYEIQVSNPGDTTAKGVQIVAHIPAGLEVDTTRQPIDFDRESRTVHWRFDELAAGAFRQLRLKARAVAEGPQLQQITATAQGASPVQTSHRTFVVGRPNLSAMVAGPDVPLEIDSAADFQITVQNTGVKAAENLLVQVTLPGGLSAIAGDGYHLTDTGLAFSPQTVPAGQQRTLTFQAAGRQAGDHIVRVTLTSAPQTRPLTSEGSVFVFDPSGDYLTAADSPLN